MTNNITQRLALFFLILALIEVLLLSSLVPLDAAFANWIEAHRSCALDYFGSLLKEHSFIALAALGGLTLAWLGVHGRWQEARHALSVIVLGGGLSKLLKTGFERARPSVLPPLIGGNSFPSGHITGALLIAGTLIFLLTRKQRAVLIKLGCAGVLVSFVGVIAWQRLYLARHWLSDVFGSFLLVSAWLCFALPRPTLLSFSRRFVFAASGLLASYLVFYFFPAARFALPSVRATIGEPVFSLSFGELSTQAVLYGAWAEPTREPVGPIIWMQKGEASVEVSLPASQVYTLKLAVRPFIQSKAFACFPLEVQVNRRRVGELLLYHGWREYELRLDPSWVVPGTNAITFQAGAAFPQFVADQRTVAFRYLHLFAEGR